MKNQKPPVQDLTTRKKLIFFGIMIATPVILLILLEAGLRVFGYGIDMSLFKKHVVWGKTYYQMNPNVKYRYFGTSAFQPSTSPREFQVPRPKGVYRIFCLGGSTTAGYPYWFNGAFPAYLETRLSKIFPEKKIQVINLGMVATNSYTALDITRELAKYQPNLIIYYGGHNEFYGALGVASNLSVGSYRFVTELYLSLVRLRTFQLLRNTIHGIVGLFTHQSNKVVRGTEMQHVAHGRLVPYESPMYRSAYAIFRENLDAMKKCCRSEGIPLILGTQVSDLRDQAPFVSKLSPGLTTKQKDEFRNLFKEGISLQSKDRWDSASADFRSAIAIDSLYADAHYRLAQCLDTTGRKLEALRQYTAARNYDELRFRTDSNFNNLIRSMNDHKYCFVADVVKAFKAASPDSLIGHNLIFEHLHPNSHGAFLLAKCYAGVMQRNGILAPARKWASADTISDGELWNDRLVTQIDEHMARLSVDWLTSGWPFKNQEPSLKKVSRSDTLDWISEEAVAGKISWVGAHVAAINHFKRIGDWNEVGKIYRSLLWISPFDLGLHKDLSDVYVREKKFHEAAEVMLNSVGVYPTLQAYKTLGDIMMRMSRPDSAVTYYEKMVDFRQSANERLRNDMVLSYAYARAGYYRKARATLAEILQMAPNFEPAKRLLRDVEALEKEMSHGK